MKYELYYYSACNFVHSYLFFFFQSVPSKPSLLEPLDGDLSDGDTEEVSEGSKNNTVERKVRYLHFFFFHIFICSLHV